MRCVVLKFIVSCFALPDECFWDHSAPAEREKPPRHPPTTMAAPWGDDTPRTCLEGSEFLP